MANDKPETITLDKADLLSLIADAVAAERAQQSPAVDIQALATAIGGSVADGMAKHAPKKVSIGQYARRMAEGRHKLNREYYQNGMLLFAENLSNEAMDLLNGITHAGRYFDRNVEVLFRDEGTEQIVELRYNNKSRDQAMELRGYFRSIEDMLRQISVVQADERKTLELEKAAVKERREFGGNKAYREAVAKAEAKEATKASNGV